MTQPSILPKVIEFLWRLSLDGADEECGDVSAVGYACRLNGPFEIDRFAEIMGREPTAEEIEILGAAVGVIIEEDTMGFVSGTLYTDTEDYYTDWESIVADLEEEE